MDDATQALQGLVESILENESLTAELDDSSARVLLDWGTACARMIVERAAHQGSEQMEGLQGALHRMLRRVNQWAASADQLEPEEEAAWLQAILENAAQFFGAVPPHMAGQNIQALLNEESGALSSPKERIAALRRVLEATWPQS